MYKIAKQDPREPFRLSRKRLQAIEESACASDEVRTLSDETATARAAKLTEKAVDALKVIHEEKMKGRLARWETLCRLDGCDRMPRKSGKQTAQGIKAHRRTYVFCPRHAGLRRLITKEQYDLLRGDRHLRVIAVD